MAGKLIELVDFLVCHLKNQRACLVEITETVSHLHLTKIRSCLISIKPPNC